MVSNTGSNSPGELEITCNTSEVAVCCSRASLSSRLYFSSCFSKAIQLTLIDNRWVIEYDSELFAGACIATMRYDLLKLKISFITAYPKERDRKTVVRWSFLINEENAPLRAAGPLRGMGR